MREYKSNLFTRRHYEWFVDMCFELDLDNYQIYNLSKLLIGTNPNYNRSKFIETIADRKGEYDEDYII